MSVLNWRSAARPLWERARSRNATEAAQVTSAGFGEPAWWHIMGYEGGPPRSLEQVERQFRRLAALAHPDRGGDAQQMQRLIRARAQARVQLSVKTV